MSKELVAKEAKEREIMRAHPVPGKILREFVIPAKEYASLTMKEGETLRFVDMQGKQVPDATCRAIVFAEPVAPARYIGQVLRRPCRRRHDRRHRLRGQPRRVREAPEIPKRNILERRGTTRHPRRSTCSMHSAAIQGESE